MKPKKKKQKSEQAFLELTLRAKASVIDTLRKSRGEDIAPDDFEKLVFEKISESAKGTRFERKVERTSPNAFPDIVVDKKFGLEVKMTLTDKWISTGNSVLETTRIPNIDRIYLFFGKLGGKPDVKYKLYEECLYDIGVTHSPRYKIDMDTEEGESIFEKMKVNYQELRNAANPISVIKDYYRNLLKPDQELWWIDPEINGDSSSPIIKYFNELSAEDQNSFMTEVIALFPEIFGYGRSKYKRPDAYLMSAYSSFSSSLRDKFSAGGRVEIEIKDMVVQIPHAFNLLYERAVEVKDFIESADPEVLKHYWRVDSVSKDRLKQYKKLLNKKAILKNKHLKPSDIFEAGLK